MAVTGWTDGRTPTGRTDKMAVALVAVAAAPQKAKVIRTLLSLPFHRREEREAGWSGIVVSGLFLSCFATTMTILLLSSPSHSPCQRKPNVRRGELSLFISLSAEFGMLFLPAKIPLRFSHPCLMRPFAMSHYGGKTRGKCRTLTSCDLVITRPSIKPAVGPRI